MLGARPSACGKPAEDDRTIHIGFDFATNAPDEFRRSGTLCLLRTATQAGTKSRSLCGFGHSEK
jgi:hypothetical protein